ncbi:hypothetical protein LUZ61_009535 [Rhynchospora tenuis]|uniref:Subtilisin-like protease fibronectin type-III domain-containing protein n=1 Tax=Rhynchospora tenuis TaxID=198213 RepID=A0AAD5ZXI2_9POAL|nr:hypothetical protein LUZ61_009535 [Rhynchospora tenuis]
MAFSPPWWLSHDIKDLNNQARRALHQDPGHSNGFSKPNRGHIDPNKAVDPGLVYDIDPNDYTKFFNCTLGPSDECDSYIGQLYQLNVPSIAVPNLKDIVSVWRTVTNVGPINSTYKAFVQSPAGINVFVEPNLLSFDSNNKIKIFKVTFVTNRKVQGDYKFGSLTWYDGLNHSVRIPLAIRTIIQEFYADTT